MQESKPSEEFNLKLTRREAKFLYKLFSVYIAADKPLTEELAKASKMEKTENRLVQKLISLCKKAGVSTGKNAPDYGLIPQATVELQVARVMISEVQEEKK